MWGDESHDQTSIRKRRLLFLHAAAEHPQIELGVSLRMRVYKPLKTLWIRLGLPFPNKPEWTPAQYKAVKHWESKQALLIKKWAASHYLDFEWVHEIAREQLVTWSGWPKSEPFREVPQYMPPDFVWETWSPGHGQESEKSYRRRMLRQFTGDLDAYLRRAQRGPDRNRGSQSKHYRWTAERVCLGWTFEKIANNESIRKDAIDAGLTTQAVSKAVNKLLVKLGISARQP